MAPKLGHITQADCYINEVDVCGRVTELDPGEVAHREVSHGALGMVGVLDLPARPLQALKGRINFEWLDEEISRVIMNPTKVQNLQLHHKVDIHGPEGLDWEASHTVVTHIGFLVLRTGGGNTKLGEPVRRWHSITIPKFIQKVYGEETPLVEIDIWNNIYRINGDDVWPR